MRYQEGAILEDAFDALMESDSKNEFSMAAVWKSAGKAEAVAENTGRNQRLDCYSIKGQPEAVFGATLRCGRYFLQGEESACLLDQEAAQKLFGTEDAVGNTIELNLKKYNIVGILSGNRQICVVLSDGESTFDGIAVRRNSAEQSVQNSIYTLEMFFGSAEAVMDGQFYASSSHVLFALNLAITWFVIYMACCRKSAHKLLALIGEGHREKTKADNLIWEQIKSVIASMLTKRTIMIVGVVTAIFILIMGIRFSGLGKDYLPTYWSDFEFYGKLIRAKADAIQQLSRHQEFWHEQQIWKNWLQAAIGNSISFLLIPVCRSL